MKIESKYLIKFPNDSSPATTGALFLDQGILVTGHENGVVSIWKLSGGMPEPHKLYECSSKIQTISRSPRNEIALGSHGGDIVVLSLDGRVTVLDEPTHSVNSRVWRSLWLSENAFVTSSTYGEIKLFKRSGDRWDREQLHGHSDSVFGMGASFNGLLTTGDYHGNILVRTMKDAAHTIVQKIKIQNGVQDMTWLKNEIFVAINRVGEIYLFEKSTGEGQFWKSVYEVKDATDFGTSVNITEDGKTVFAGTIKEVIQFELENEAVDSIGISDVKKIFSSGDDIFVLTSYGLQHFKRTRIEVRPDLIKYKYFKIGLVGHTGVGKSTLCNFLTTGSFSDLPSTLGKKIWNWDLPKDNSQEKRLILHDHGGQETVLYTFLPFLVDSDLVLILWQQNDGTTLKKALQIYDKLAPKIADRTKIFFVQTHIDAEMGEFDQGIIDDLIKKEKIIANPKISAKFGTGIDELKESISNEISWDNARLIVQTASANGVLKTIMALQEENISAMSVEKFMERYERETKLKIPKTHLKFLLRDYNNQGIIEYNPKILDLIIFNDPEYNKLKTNIPIFVMKKNGIISISAIKKEFRDNRFLPVIDAMYLKYRIAIENFEQRIFPELLIEEPIEVSGTPTKYLKEVSTNTKFLPDQDVDAERLIEALSELKLRCINAGKLSGLFSWEENAVVYYNFERFGNFFDGFSIRCDFRVGGKKQQICDRLNREFIKIIERLFGPFVNATKDNDKKKVDLKKRNIIHDVAISYASEQLDYAQEVANTLIAKGIRVFFDKFLETKMWGKDLPSYLKKVYYDESQYCMIFISKDYVSKAWPTFELELAIARSIESMGDYILPIRFDDSEVPGLVPTIKYINANEKTPAEIAELFMEKLKD